MKQGLFLLLVGLAAVQAALAGAVKLTDDERLDVPVKLNFKEAPTRMVLEALFGAAGVGMEVDPCVTGHASLTLENVTARQAIESLAGMADLTIEQDAPGHTVFVGCAGRARDARPAVDVELNFRIDRLGDAGSRETLDRPRLVVRAGEPATIGVRRQIRLYPDGTTTKEGIEIDARGRPSTAPSVSIEAVALGPDSSGRQQVRGVFELSSYGEDGGLRSARRAFRAMAPEAGGAAEATRLDFNGATYVLTVEQRPATSRPPSPKE